MNSSRSEFPNSESASSHGRSTPTKAGPPDSQMLAAGNNQGGKTLFTDDAPSGPNIGGQPEAPAAVSGEGTNSAHPKETEGNRLLLQRGYKGHSYVDRSYDYMRKYPPDAKGKELDPDARAWKVYLDESESYDDDMVKGFRDTIDANLVFAALFSAVVTGFVIETSQVLEPDYARINVNLLFEQNQLIRAAGNASQMETIPKSPLGPDSVTHSDRDVLVNFMFFTSLALSLATALMAILTKQWLQAFTTLIPGDAKERSMIRQFRLAGLEKWKLRELVNILPLFLHLALGLFLAGLSGFVYDFHTSIRCAVISIAGIAFAFYFTTAALPAIWLDCPYRQPILYIPSCIVVYSFNMIRYCVQRAYRSMCQFHMLEKPPCPLFSPSPLSSRERDHVTKKIREFEASSLAWLFSQTTNISVKRIAIHSVARFLQKHVCVDDEGCKTPPGRDLAQQYLPLDALRSIALPTLITATEKLEDDDALREFVLHVSHLEPKLLNLGPPEEMWHSAIMGSQLELFLEGNILLMDQYFDPRTKLTGHGVHHACRLGNWDSVKILIRHIPKSHLIDFGSDDKTVLGYASDSNTISDEDWAAIVQLIRARDVDLNTHQVSRFSGNTVLHAVCERAKLAAVQYLFAQVDNLDCHVRNNRDETPLHCAVHDSSPSHASIVNILLQEGADVGACLSRGMTVLHCACLRNCSPNVIQTLCSTTSGRECINYRDKDGDTPMLCAFYKLGQWKQPELLQVIQLLLSAGADPNIASSDGWIPLHRACGHFHPTFSWSPFPKVVQELIRHTDKFNINALTNHGETPLDVLAGNFENWGDEFDAISSWMCENGAKPASKLELNESAKT